MKLGHPLVARNEVQDKLHLAPQDKTAALRTAKTLLPFVRFKHLAGTAQTWMMISMEHVGLVSCPFKFLKIALDGPTSSRDDVAIIHHV